jgi:hypothetical protein
VQQQLLLLPPLLLLLRRILHLHPLHPRRPLLLLDESVCLQR